MNSAAVGVPGYSLESGCSESIRFASCGGTARINSKSSPSPRAWSNGVEPSASCSAKRRASSASGTAAVFSTAPQRLSSTTWAKSNDRPSLTSMPACNS